MKWLLLALLIGGGALVAFGPPGPRPVRGDQFGRGSWALPMTFAHKDHGSVTCATCHHEFAKRIPGPSCVTCHLTDAKVAPLFEEQFHNLCRSCHVEDHAAGKAAGPTRRCLSCHLPDNKF
ncbi:cytochrome c3 family protein [Paracoccus aminophilus]|uniref:Cytochrome C class III n=1 Tax=Paracoccus aminophilus JCM 7686 TaxID=1367847 RepID=S5YH10_PARAH|nr:cytochrome c3 family protein [Paracoccus aminophilus]AGT10758.1 cytochrome C class III [Paracoccus aminophilus JCM 7686]